MEHEIPQWMKDHEKRDIERFEQLNTIISGLATKEDMKLLATEKSVRDVVHWQRNIVAAGEVLSVGGKFGYRTVLVLATFIGALAVITGGWKAFFIWLIPR